MSPEVLFVALLVTYGVGWLIGGRGEFSRGMEAGKMCEAGAAYRRGFADGIEHKAEQSKLRLAETIEERKRQAADPSLDPPTVLRPGGKAGFHG